MSFADLKKQSKMGSLTEKLIKQVEKLNDTGSKDDERFWKPVMDKGGTGSAIIRFLPAPEGCDLPWVQVWSHAFQSNGKWMIDNCLTTLGQNCPVCEANRELWNTGSKDNQNIVRDRKRKLSYFANIYVVKDPANPANEGRVFLYKFGKKIFDKIMASMQPEFDDEEPINPFDFWKGANFKLKLVKKDGYWNYDKSEFDRVAPLLDDDDAMEAVWKKEYSLAAVVAADQFKSYEDLEKRLKYVLGQKSAPRPRLDEEVEDEDNDRGSYTPDFTSRRPEPELPVVSSSNDEDEDDALSYFQRLAEE